MPIPTLQTVTYDVHDAKYGSLLTDTSGAGAPTYGAWTDVPGVQQVTMNTQFITAELKGDAKIIDTRSKVSGFDVTCNYAIFDLGLLVLLFGGTLVNTTTTEATWELMGQNSQPYGRLGFAVNDVSTGLGNIVVVLNKVKVTSGNLFDQQTDQYGSRSMGLSAIAPISNDKLLKVTLNTTLKTIELTAP